MNTFDKFLFAMFPRLAAKRSLARLAVRRYEAAQPTRRTSGWNRDRGDANSVTRTATTELRLHARDLRQNNAWAGRGISVIANNVVGWGIVPKPVGVAEAVGKSILEAWKAWADTTECDAEGRMTLAGLQHLAMTTIVESGEVLIRRRRRLATDGLSIPLQIQILEPDFLDTSKDGEIGEAGGPIVQGVEHDKLGRRAAFWIFSEHPGSSTATAIVSRRIPASEITLVSRVDRPGQVRGVSWLGAAIVPLKDFDEYEDATLMRQKIAACFAAFITDQDGTGAINLGDTSGSDPLVESIEPGMVASLPVGKEISFTNPPNVTEGSFRQNNLRRIASALGVTYEDMTGDYSQVNFSSARMARLAHWRNVSAWQFNLLIPQLCDVVWLWAMEALLPSGVKALPRAAWTVPPMPMIEPDKEGLALQRLVRVGAMTPSDMVREQGGDPDTHWEEYAADMEHLRRLNIKLDSDVRAVSQAGLTQERAGMGGGGAPPAAESERSVDIDLSDLMSFLGNKP